MKVFFAISLLAFALSANAASLTIDDLAARPFECSNGKALSFKKVSLNGTAFANVAEASFSASQPIDGRIVAEFNSMDSQSGFGRLRIVKQVTDMAGHTLYALVISSNSNGIQILFSNPGAETLICKNH